MRHFAIVLSLCVAMPFGAALAQSVSRPQLPGGGHGGTLPPGGGGTGQPPTATLPEPSLKGSLPAP